MGARRRCLPRVLGRWQAAGLALFVAAALVPAAPTALRATNEFPDTPSTPVPGPGSGVLKPPTKIKPYLPPADPGGTPATRTPTQPRQCPRLIGLTLEAARQLIIGYELALDPVTYRPSDGKPGTIVDQDTVARPGRGSGSCSVVVAQAWTVVVPRLVGATLDGARAALRDPSLHGLLGLGREVQQRESDQRPGTIVAQTPEAGTKVTARALVYVVLATPRPSVLVPKVVGKMRQDAEAAIADRAYRGWLSLVVSGSRDSPLPPGTILDQSPPAGRTIYGPAQLLVVIARAPVVTVPNLVGLVPKVAGDSLSADSFRGLLRLDLIGERPAPDRPAGTIVAQDPPAGTRVTQPTAIKAWVAAPPVRVPDLATMTAPDAGALLRAERFRGLLGLGAQHQRRATARVGTIVDQKPPPQTPVTAPTKIEIWVAEAAPSVVVPDLVDSRPPDAKVRLAAETFGGLLSLGDIREREADKPAGVIVEQQPIAGAKVSAATRIDVWVATARLVVVPDLSTLTREGALVALTKAGLTLGGARSERSDRPSGSVIGQTPEAGRRVPVGTVVSIVLVAPPAFSTPSYAIAAVLVVLLVAAAHAAWRRWRPRLPRVAYAARAGGAPEVTLEAPEPAGSAVRLRADPGPHQTYTIDDGGTRPRRRRWPKTP